MEFHENHDSMPKIQVQKLVNYNEILIQYLLIMPRSIIYFFQFSIILIYFLNLKENNKRKRNCMNN